jgi:tight adherence protein B
VSAFAAALVMLMALVARRGWSAWRANAVRRRFTGDDRGPFIGQLPPAPGWLPARLEGAGFEWSAEAAWWGWVVGVAAVAAVGLLAGGLPVALLAAGFTVAASALVLRTRQGRGDARLEAALPGALEAVARSLRSGASLRQAVAEAAVATPGLLGRELAEVARQVSHGATLVAALEAFGRRRPLPGVRLTVAALCLGVETGGALARAVDGVASTLRDRIGVAAEVRALSSQARLSALVIGLAPVAFGGFAVTTDPRTAQFLFRTPAGLFLLAAGITLDGLGWLWMQRLSRVAA